MGKYDEQRQQVILNFKQNGGNLKKAMIDAGYSETYADKNSQYLLGIIGEEIKAHQDEVKSSKIKSIAEIQEWWTAEMENAENGMQNRIKCSELLAKSQGAFIDKLEVNGQINNPFADLSTEDLKKLIDNE